MNLLTRKFNETEEKIMRIWAYCNDVNYEEDMNAEVLFRGGLLSRIEFLMYLAREIEEDGYYSYMDLVRIIGEVVFNIQQKGA